MGRPHRKKPTDRKHRKGVFFGKVIGLSIGTPGDLLAHGFGEEHLREVLTSVCRPLLRRAADLAYGGDFRKGSFTHDILQLIGAEQDSAEQIGAAAADGDQRQWIGKLYNHSPWPGFLRISTQDKARWVNCCDFIPIDEAWAGIPPNDCVLRVEEGITSPRIAWNKAIVLTALRRAMATELPGVEGTEPLRISARIVIGGKVGDKGTPFSGIMPGIFEEVLFALENRIPLFILGGFGGAAGKLAEFLLSYNLKRPESLELDYYRKHTPGYSALLDAFDRFDQPPSPPFAGPRIPFALQPRRPEEALNTLWNLIIGGRPNLKGLLNNNLDDALKENARLLETTDRDEAARLVLKGLCATLAGADTSCLGESP